MKWPASRVDRRAIAALVAVVVTVACVAAPVQNAAARTVVVWVDTPAIGASIRQRIGSFMQEHPSIQVSVFDQAGAIRNGDVSTAIEALRTTTVAPDVIALTDRDFGLMSNQADLLNLGPFVIEQSDFQTSDFFPSTLEAFRDHGKQFAIPSEVIPWVVFYNKTLFDRAHVPYPEVSWTDGQFLTATGYVQGILTANGRDQQVGFVTDAGQAMLPFIETFGVDPGDAADDPFAKWLTDRRSVDAAQWFVDLVLRAKVMPYDQRERTLGLWFEGRAGVAAMFMDQREQLPSFFRRDEVATPTPTTTPKPPAGWEFPWGVTMLPRADVETSVFYISGYGISQTSRNPDDAWLLIDFLTRHLPQQTGRAYVPARQSLAFSPEFAALYPETGRDAYTRSVLKGHRIPVWPPAANPTADDLRGMFEGSVHPANGLQAYRDRILPLIKPSPPPTPTPIGYVAPPPGPQ